MNKLMGKVFTWMTIGLLLTFGVGYFVSTNEVMYENVYNTAWYIGFAIAELVLVIFLAARVMKMKPTTAKCMFILYSIISGLTFSSIFVYYELTSIIYVFLATAVVFGILALLGYTTKIDLTKMGTYFFIGLLGAILVTVINVFLGNPMVDLVVSVVCLILFIGITMYDVQKLKRLADSNLPQDNLAIYGALDLYLDFINIFLHLLELFGRDN